MLHLTQFDLVPLLLGHGFRDRNTGISLPLAPCVGHAGQAVAGSEGFADAFGQIRCRLAARRGHDELGKLAFNLVDVTVWLASMRNTHLENI